MGRQSRDSGVSFRRPFRPRFESAEIRRDIEYGERPRNRLDLYLPRHLEPGAIGHWRYGAVESSAH